MGGELGKVRVDGAEMRVQEGEAGGVDGVCGDEKVFLGSRTISMRAAGVSKLG